MEEMIEITVVEYNRLLDRESFLDALHAAGVDNWRGYDEAISIYNGEDN